MTKILLTLLALGALISGFTCSKNTPEQSSAPVSEPSVSMEPPEKMESPEGPDDLGESEAGAESTTQEE